MTRLEALKKIVKSLPKGTLCEGCGALEERCVCPPPEYYVPEICKQCKIPNPVCEHCELVL